MDARNFTRRDLIGSATLAGIAATSAAWLGTVRTAHARDEATARSALATGKPIPLDYTDLPGFLSKEQVGLHHTRHYGGAIKGFVGVEGRLYGPEPVRDSATRRALGKAQSAKTNSVILHELYFAGMQAGGGVPGPAVAAALKSRFGSLDRWRADFTACALTCTGWAMLAAHPLNGRLYHVTSDAHDVGPLWFARPLIVLDMYEHAFYVDYRTDKQTYVSRFLEHVNWTAVERRRQAAG